MPTAKVAEPVGDARLYRFGDASRPGLLLGMGARQAIPVIGGVVVLAVVLQMPLPPMFGLLGPIIGIGLAFGRWRGTPVSEVLVPAVGLVTRRASGRGCWVRPSLVGDNGEHAIPPPLRGLELIEPADRPIGVVRDRTAGTVTAAMRVYGQGFPLAAPAEQDAMLAAWGAALSPTAREQSAVCRVTWQEWAHPVTSETHRSFLETAGVLDRIGNEAVADYLALIEERAPATIAHDVLVMLTIDQRRVRSRWIHGSRLATGLDTLVHELRLLTTRLEAAGLQVDEPLSGLDLAAAGRIRSDPSRAAHVTTLARSLAAAANRGALEWGPMVVEADWRHVHVDGAYHRAYRVANWPRLPVAGDWLSGLLCDSQCIRTVTVVMEPIPMNRAARAADREVMAREADSELKERKGFRVNARERKRLADAERRERELSEGHAEFSFVGFVTVAAGSLQQLDDDCAAIEQAAARCLLDLRPLDARHDLGWVAALPFGRTVTVSRTP